jgi:hypothetical protein
LAACFWSHSTKARSAFQPNQARGSVTEQRKDLEWEKRKREALEHIKTFSHDSLLVKAADVISNVWEFWQITEKKGRKPFSGLTRQKTRS